MKINPKNAISHFFPSPCFEQVYFEAVANAIYAGATEISIFIEIASFDKANTLTITIKDNGEGFIDENFEKFCSLLETDSSERKGLGRLIYLAYFNEIKVTSQFSGTKKRSFLFSNTFTDENEVANTDDGPSGTTLVFKRFSGERIKSYGDC